MYAVIRKVMFIIHRGRHTFYKQIRMKQLIKTQKSGYVIKLSNAIL